MSSQSGIVGFFKRPDILALAAVMVVVITVIGFYYGIRALQNLASNYPTAANIVAQTQAGRTALAIYDTTYGKRASLLDTIGTSASRPSAYSSLPAGTLCLTNFYIATALNCAVYGSVVSTDFITSVIRGGARCLDLVVFPDNPTNPCASPVVCYGNLDTRVRTTLNSVAFDDACRTIVQQALELPNGTSSAGLKNASDPLFILLRCRPGRNAAMLTSMAASLERHFASYRLPYTYYNSARQNTMFSDPIEIFEHRVTFLTDVSLVGTPLAEYMNITLVSSSTPPPAGTSSSVLQQTLWTDQEIAELDAAGSAHLQASVQQRPTVIMPVDVSKDVNFAAAQAIGAHFVAVDYTKTKGPLMLAHTLGTTAPFATTSLVLKPASLLYTPVVSARPTPPGPEFNANGGILALPAAR